MKVSILEKIRINSVLTAISSYNEKNMKNSRRDRHCWALIFKYEGETQYICGGKKYISNMSSPILLPKSSNYDWQCTESGHYMSIEFDCDEEYDSLLVFSTKNHEKLLKIMKNIEYKMTLKQPFYMLECIELAYSALNLLLREEMKAYVPSKKQKKLEGAVEYIINNIDTKMTNDMLAEVAGMPTVTFRKLFTDLYGMPPMSYVSHMKTEKAKQLLLSDRGSISDIAQALGYPSIYDFSRSFKRHTGVSPKNYTGDHTEYKLK